MLDSRTFGTWAGLLAAITLTVMPITMVINRSNFPDPFLILFMLLATWAVTLAVENGSLKWLLVGAIMGCPLIGHLLLVQFSAALARTHCSCALGNLAISGRGLALGCCSGIDTDRVTAVYRRHQHKQHHRIAGWLQRHCPFIEIFSNGSPCHCCVSWHWCSRFMACLAIYGSNV
ncbi:MAG: glycosyltransferase family 39 protein [Chloroflexi bacterium]|nr:glycosyltransferase family 39 protein [Chloroflexota bacterium]